ncbi:MAG: STAS/SEC14 domain-containing protein [Cytophagales bacterium]|nr:STAS/SEC14 domain-containing protein [Bernardetiaceae bacterium]MDW8205491.1 STAS/SEC14 domain-containing protein [Cytophagales bacterium]
MESLSHIPIIGESQFAIFRYDAANNIGYQLYKGDSTALMTEEEYKEEMQRVLHYCLEKQISNLLADTRNFLFVITPPIQEWTDANIFAPNIYLKKLALIVSEDFVSQLALEQVIEEGSSARFVTRFFSNIESAEQWLKS